MKVLGIFTLAILLTVGFMSLDTKKENKAPLSDKYKVIKVNGQILFKQSKSAMKTGDFFVAGTQLSFSDQQSRAAIVSKVKGRFVLSASSKGQVKILPATNNVSSRAGALINLIDIKNHFSGNYLVIGAMELEIGEEAFPQDENNFFYLTYKYKGELIRKKLKADGNKLLLNSDDIFKVDGKAIPIEKYEMSLFYREGKTSKTINVFTPVFPDLTELKTEVQIILDEYADKDSKEQIQEVTSYLNEFYGKPNNDNLKKWLSEEFKIK